MAQAGSYLMLHGFNWASRARSVSKRSQVLRMVEEGVPHGQIAAELSMYIEEIDGILREQRSTDRLCHSRTEPHPDLPDNWASQPLVYFMYALGASAVKIGFTAAGLVERLRGIETGCPFELIPAAVILGGMKDESLAHRSLWRHHIRGEWFDSHADVWAYAERRGKLVYHHWLEPWAEEFHGIHGDVATDEHTAHNVAVATAVRSALSSSSLTDKERQVISLRFGMSDTCEELTLEKAAQRLSISRERVRQLERQAIDKLGRNRLMADLGRTA